MACGKGTTMQHLGIGREFITVFGVIAIVTAIWAAMLLEMPGFMPL